MSNASINHIVQAIGISIQANIPVLLWGGPGNGKTSTINAIGRALGYHTEVVLGSLSEPSDFAGLPVVTDTNEVVMAPKAWAKRLSKVDKGLLFLDEITTVPPVTQAALLRVILEGVVGDLKLPDGVSRIAAANPPEMAAGGFDLSMPLSNRLVHIDWDLPFQSWSIGMLSGFEDPVIPKLPSDWKSRLSLSRVAVVSYLRTNPNGLYSLPKDEAKANKGWPSHRSWDMVSKILASCNSINANDEIINLLIKGAVGPGAAIEFQTFMSKVDLPDPEELLDNPNSVKFPKGMDKQFIILNSLVSAVLNNYSVDRWEAVWKILGKAMDSIAEDITLPSARTLIEVISDRISSNRMTGQLMTPESSKIMSRFGVILQKAGLII